MTIDLKPRAVAGIDEPCVNDGPYDKRALLSVLLARIPAQQDNDHDARTEAEEAHEEEDPPAS